jgi:hypothetical protein
MEIRAFSAQKRENKELTGKFLSNKELGANLGKKKDGIGPGGVEQFPKSCQNMAKSHSVVEDGG